jgi:heterodisulfide reductase subunit A-like polyferredoxin
MQSNRIPNVLNNNTCGAVMVVGAGIAGIQAALDLADQGFKVYLVEKKSAIGGHMAQLDKTFPTNDCAMCSISPKLVDTGRNLNIEILTNTDLLALEGEAGNFTATLRHRPRYIDTTKCIGCGDCAEVCPVALPDPYEEGLRTHKASYRLYAQAVPAAYAINKRGTAPCRNGCPAEQRAQGYIALIAQGRYREAFRVIKEDNPFPSVCGRTCHHPCESQCSRKLVDEPVNIMGLKRFVMDYSLAFGREKVEPVSRTRHEWIAVVGSGPAGLTTAHDLAKLGYGVTVYEALPVAGGMMRVGIPAHRLPKGVLQQDIDDILSLGVVLKTNTPIKDPKELLNQGYNAVCLATGISSRDQSLGIEGEEAEGVISAATFLRKINLGEPIQIGNRVAVVGGGITALDAAAVARRLGAEDVYLAYDRPRGELPAYLWETESVEAEGIHFLESTTVTRILTSDGKVHGVEFARTTKGMSIDARGRRQPKIEAGSEFVLAVDTIIGTVGQFSDLNYLDPSIEELAVDRESLACEIPGLFVIGGRKTGASYIIEAIALGHRAAKSIHNFLLGDNLDIEDVARPPVVKLTDDDINQMIEQGQVSLQGRISPALLPMEERVTSFREVVLGLTEHQARQEAQRCLQCGICSECLACVYACGVNAIDHNMVEYEQNIQVGAVILAPGYQIYSASLSEEFGLDRYQNVITALQFERMLSASGPTAGHIKRLSDNQIPHRIAFLQCIGSRDQEHDYCSAVCCMYATKEAMMAKEHHPELDVHVYMMDMRAFSKGYQDYFERAQRNYGVQFHRCRVSSLQENPATRDLTMVYQTENGELQQERFDMVVLSVGMEISESVRDLGHRINIELDDYGFCHTMKFKPIETSRPGIYVAGPFREPKDIPESVVEASAASAASASLLAANRWSLTQEREYPTERDISNEQPRIGVFVCHCGSNIGGFLDVPQVTNYASELPYVVHAENNLYTCSQDSIELIIKKIEEFQLNRVVVASCSPLTHGPLFQDSLRRARLNPYLFEMANIRNHCSWVHSMDHEAATEKAKDLIRMAVSRSILLEAQHTKNVPVQHSALVIGGGPAGMTAAITLAEQGFPVNLVEIGDKLGGNLNYLHTLLSDSKGTTRIDAQQFLHQLLERVANHVNITIHLKSQIIGTKGSLGNFTSTIEDANGVKSEIVHGATILATGGREYHGSDYGYGSDPRILTQQEFEDLLANKPTEIENLKSVVMIQCVGPGEKFCSRICCTVAIKNALSVKEQNPEAQVVILYKDIRTYGFKERYYTEARRKGVLFIRYDETNHPKVEIGDFLAITIKDPSLKRWITFYPDQIVLSMPVIPAEDIHKLSSLFKVPVDTNGFFMEAHVKLRPVDFATDGIFMAGMAHYPKLVDEAVIQAQAAAARAARVLSMDTLTVGGRVAVVDEALCTGCLTCVRICPFNVPSIRAELTGIGSIQGAAFIEASTCQGCGLCVAECPARAIKLMHFTDEQMHAKVHALMESNFVRISTDEITTV